MPLNKDIKKVLVIGSGPIVIGQAAEFDYAGTQACRALREDNIEIVLVNSNPATIMTDNAMADKIYIEPLTLTTIKRIIEKEKPDSLLSTLGGQTGLTLSMQLAREGFLKKHNVRLLGAKPETIDKAEDRQIFKDTMESIGQPCVPSDIATTLSEAVRCAKIIGYPVIVRPAFTLGGTGGGIANDEAELKEIAANGLALSPIKQVLIEKCISGWKEIEFEVIRDSKNNVITVCSMENVDPVGVHTGDSIVVAPALTLSDKEYEMLRTAALDIINAMGVEGGCNCQFALNPNSFEYAVIEVNPRVSRSSALASKATGYPIAKVATKIAIGYTLDEIINAVTGNTCAAFEPTIDYVAVKFPKWPFDKFVYAKRELGTQMKATGEVMSIGDSFESALLKAVRGAEISVETLNLKKLEKYTADELRQMLKKVTDERLFVVYEALKKGVSAKEINEITLLDMWFLARLENLLFYERQIAGKKLTDDLYIKGKKLGYTDRALEGLSGSPVPFKMKPVYKMVDTCAGEFAASTPYFYAIHEREEAGAENEAPEFIAANDKKTVIVLGSGPIRIGQGIEFDYASVHCVWSLKKLGYNVVIINNNPETVSTDFDTSDRLYFEPLTPEDVLNIIEIERPVGVVVSFGGQTAIKLAKTLHEHGVKILGTSFDGIDMAEDRERFDALLEMHGIKRPRGHAVTDEASALAAAHDLGFPVLMRPSYVIGGQNMTIAFNDDDIREYTRIIFQIKQDCPVLIDKYISGMEIEVDAICDGEDILMPGIMEHIEMTGIHSGDSIAVYPAVNIDDNLAERISEVTKNLCLGLNAIGLINLQYIIKNNEIYVIEVNPRASRTVPYISKVAQLPMCDIATRVSLGEKLKDMGYGTGYYKQSPYICAKVPIFSFEKLIDVDTQLGPEMKSTGEVLGMGKNLGEALYKGLVASGCKMVKKGGVFIAVKDIDKPGIPDLAKKFDRMGFKLYATVGTAQVIKQMGIKVNVVQKIHENPQNVLSLFDKGLIQYIISTSARGSNPARDSFKIRRRAVQLGIPCLTSIDTANALADSLLSRYSEFSTELIDINNLRKSKLKIPFIKMQSSGNDYIYLDCGDSEINSPESLSISFADRNYGIGGDGVVVLKRSKSADYMMRIFNVDGSEGKMSGNAIACVAKYLFDSGIVPKLTMQIETISGVRTVSLVTKNGQAIRATIEMGKPEFAPERIPVGLEGVSVIDQIVDFDGETFSITCLSLGNPHCVIFSDNIESLRVDEIGPKIENSKLFPERVNVEFVQVINDKSLRIRVWERGNGETLACGTGACAAAVAAALNGYCKLDEDITVVLRGGKQIIRVTDDMVTMTCTPIKVFEGVIEI
jgi:carbamoyl-phosphate synthase large subunit